MWYRPVAQIKSHNAPSPYPTMHHFVAEICTCVDISVAKWRIMGHLSNVLWDLWNRSIGWLYSANTENKDTEILVKCLLCSEIGSTTTLVASMMRVNYGCIIDYAIKPIILNKNTTVFLYVIYFHLPDYFVTVPRVWLLRISMYWSKYLLFSLRISPTIW